MVRLMRIDLSVFPKFLRRLDADRLCGSLHDVGLECVNLVVRDGYWATRSELGRQTADFVATAAHHGLRVPICTLGMMPSELVADDEPLRILADHGISAFRLGYYRFRRDAGTLSEQLAAAREDLRTLVPACRRHGLRAIYQIHHGTLVNSPSLAALLSEGLPVEAIGVMCDPGNQFHEGNEDWGRAGAVLGSRWAALGAKDALWDREEGEGWRRRWVACPDGVTDWDSVAREFLAAGGGGTWVLMPFYHEDDESRHLREIEREVAYLRPLLDRAIAEADPAPVDPGP